MISLPRYRHVYLSTVVVAEHPEKVIQTYTIIK